MRRPCILATVLIILLALSTVPTGSADYTVKTEPGLPDEIHLGFESDPADENKTEAESMRTSLSSISVQTVNTTVKRKDSSSLERGTVSFPYDKWNWSIQKCYRSDDGLRLYGIFFHDEKILYDYRVPWVKIDGDRYPLDSDSSTGAPSLYVWNTLKAFKIQVDYVISEENVEVSVYSYFYEDGSFDPWVYVDCLQGRKDVVVGQRFDFDLDGAGDDNADFFVANSTWQMVEEEDDHPDAGNPEDHWVQWRLYDTDVLGTSYTIDQMVKMIPYHIDDASLTILVYHGSQVSGDPSSYDNDEATGLYRLSTYDPYIGYDLVAWYVSTYDNVRSCNPGPWTVVEV